MRSDGSLSSTNDDGGDDADCCEIVETRECSLVRSALLALELEPDVATAELDAAQSSARGLVTLVSS